jgi:peptidoglycan hydrolase-like protein with peptidoglycan-binding domain
VSIAPVKPTAPVTTTYARTLSVGARGADVVALQTFLEQKGFLTMPSGISKGIFGALTRAAVAKYQSSRGIVPSVGLFGPLTRAKLASEQSLAVAKPTLPTTAITSVSSVAIPAEVMPSAPRAEEPPIEPQTFSQLAKSLFATPIDALITLSFLIAIVFITFKIIKR